MSFGSRTRSTVSKYRPKPRVLELDALLLSGLIRLAGGQPHPTCDSLTVQSSLARTFLYYRFRGEMSRVSSFSMQPKHRTSRGRPGSTELRIPKHWALRNPTRFRFIQFQWLGFRTSPAYCPRSLNQRLDCALHPQILPRLRARRKAYCLCRLPHLLVTCKSCLLTRSQWRHVPLRLPKSSSGCAFAQLPACEKSGLTVETANPLASRPFLNPPFRSQNTAPQAPPAADP